MKVFIKNKMISWGGSSNVLDESKQIIYKVKGRVKFLSPTKKKFMYDKDGNLLYTIRNRWFNFFANKVFVFDAEKNKVATIKKNKFSITGNYQIEDSVDSMQIKGKIFSRHSQIIRNEQVVANITQDFSIVNDYFTLEANETDIPFMTAIVIAFDNIKDKIQDND